MRVAAASAVLLATLLSAPAARAEERPFRFALAIDERSPLEACGSAAATGKDASYGYAAGMGSRPINDAPPPLVR